jgi:hypothetical protein
MVKIILRQTVDLLFLAVILGMLIAWIINPTNNFTGALVLTFNIISKVRLIMNPDLLKRWTHE